MMKSSGIVTVVLLAVVGACGGDRDVGSVADDAGMVAMDPDTAGGMMMDQGPMGMGETAQMQEVDGSGVGGEVTINDRGTQTEVLVRLTGAPPNASHPGHIHSGTCAAIGGVVQPLEPVSTGADGTGSVTATADIAPMTVMNGQHIVVYHGAGGRPVACAEIPAHRM